MSSVPTPAVWWVRPSAPPAVRRRCPRCDVPRAFASSGRFRVNAHKRRLDVWLVYKCWVCEATWNREVHARVSPEALAPARYQAYLANDPAVARAVACATSGLPIEPVEDFRVDRVGVGPQVELRVEGPGPRLDRVLARALGWPRAEVQAAVRGGGVVVEGGARALRRPARDGQRVTFVPQRGSSSTQTGQ